MAYSHRPLNLNIYTSLEEQSADMGLTSDYSIVYDDGATSRPFFLDAPLVDANKDWSHFNIAGLLNGIF